VDPADSPHSGLILNEIDFRVVYFSVVYRAALEKLLALLCVSTLLLAQAFGATAGYLCRCGGEERLTQVDHCHGPHSNGCHDSEEVDGPREHLHEASDGADRENHEPLRSQVELLPSSEVAAPALVSVLLTLDPRLALFGFRKKELQHILPLRKVSLSPPVGVFVSRTVVLLM
jgi:hypothetical protein